MNSARASTVCGLIFGILLINPASAQVERSGGGVSAQLAQQYQQALAERTQLQAENAKLQQELGEAKKQLEAAKQQMAAFKLSASNSQAALTAAQTSKQSTAKSLEQNTARTQELVDRFRETVTTLRGVETDRSQLQQQLRQTMAAVDSCAQRNVQLSQINAELLDRYQHQGLFEHLARAEPFTQIERTKIDNLVLEDRQRVEELRAGQAAVPAATPAAAPATTPASAPTAPGKN